MKKVILLMAGVSMAFMSLAQLKTPALSPTVKIEQTVGLTNFELEYSRPSLRGRDLYKEIITPGEMWRFGANKNTTISFDTPVTIMGQEVEKGKYAIYALPKHDVWTFYLYKDTENWGLPKKFDEKKVVAKFESRSALRSLDRERASKAELAKEKAELRDLRSSGRANVETFTIAFTNLSVNDFILLVSWQDQSFPVKIDLPTKKMAMESIKETMSKKEVAESDYFRAGSYLLNEGIEYKQALEYTEMAIKLKKDAPVYYYFNRALLLEKVGDKDGAIKQAKECIDMAKKSGMMDYANKAEKAIAEWSR